MTHPSDPRLEQTGPESAEEDPGHTEPTEVDIPDSPLDVMGETPELWPGADDVFRTIAPTAANDAHKRHKNGVQINDAAVFAADAVLSEYLGYSDSMRRDAENALINWMLTSVFGRDLTHSQSTKFEFDQPLKEPRSQPTC